MMQKNCDTCRYSLDKSGNECFGCDEKLSQWEGFNVKID